MNYYNENDPKAAAWIRELIKEGCISEGVVDERSIVDVHASDLSEYRQCHFFAGIGGWSYALRLAGVPDDEPVWTGSCPCQPFSNAGKRKGTEDERHLWPVFFNLIAQRNPSVVFGEQVASKAGREWLTGVFADLESVAYAGAGADLCAASVGAPHPRQRIYWVANTNGGDSSTQWEQRSWQYGQQSPNNRNSSRIGNSTSTRLEGEWDEYCPLGSREVCGFAGLAMQDGVPAWNGTTLALLCEDGARRASAESRAFPVAHGIPARMGRLRGYGNAIVPQLAAEFIKAFYEALHDVRSHVLTFSPK